MTTLLVGFDSAWTGKNRGAIAGAFLFDDGTLQELGPLQPATFAQAQGIIVDWQAVNPLTATIVMLDQSTIVKNAAGQRPVENIVSSPVGRRYGAVQPSSTSKIAMFGNGAPVWSFLAGFGGPADPLEPVVGTRVFETYPVLTLLALDWTLPDDARAMGRLPKYNPDRKKTFSILDWQHVCKQVSTVCHASGLEGIAGWIDSASQNTTPNKSHQDFLDACICLLVAIHFAEQKDCLMVGDQQTGYMIVPSSAGLKAELEARCRKIGRVPSEWVRVIRMAS